MGFNADVNNGTGVQNKSIGERLRSTSTAFATAVTLALAACGGQPGKSPESQEKPIDPIALDVTGRNGDTITLSLPNGVTLSTESSEWVDITGANTLLVSKDMNGNVKIVVVGTNTQGNSIDIPLELNLLPSFKSSVTADVSINSAVGTFTPNLPVTTISWGTLPVGFSSKELTKNTDGSYVFALDIAPDMTAGVYQIPVNMTGVDGKKSVSNIQVTVDRVAPSIDTSKTSFNHQQAGFPNPDIGITEYALSGNIVFHKPVKNLSITVEYLNGAGGVYETATLTPKLTYSSDGTQVSIQAGPFPYAAQAIFYVEGMGANGVIIPKMEFDRWDYFIDQPFPKP